MTTDRGQYLPTDGDLASVYTPAIDDNFSRVADLGINVKAYGAVGDAVTDDSAAIQAAIDDVTVGLFAGLGGTVYIPKGKYVLGTGLTCPYTSSGLSIIGEGMTGISDNLGTGSTQLIVGDGEWGITLGTTLHSEFRGYRLENLHFYEDNAGQALGGVRVLTSNNGCFTRLACGGFTAGTGIYLEGPGGSNQSQYTMFIDCRVGRCLYGFHQVGAIGTRWIGGQADGSQNGVLSPIADSIGFWAETGDTFTAIGTLAAGYETLWDLGPQSGHSLTGIRCELWETVAVRVRAGSKQARINGSGDNSLIGNHGTGVLVEGLSGHLGADMINGVVTSFTLDDADEAAEFPAIGGIVDIGAERIAVGTRSGTTFSGCIRGFEGTPTSAHLTGVEVTSHAEDCEDSMAILNVSSVAARHVDHGTRTRYPQGMGRSAQASVITGALIGKVPHYNVATGALDGYTPLYEAITGIALASKIKGATNNTTGVTTLAMTVPSAGVSVGSMIMVGGGYGGGSTRTVTCADTKSNTYTVDRHDDLTTGGTPHSFIISAPVTTALVGGDIITVTFSGTVNYPIAYTYEYTGVAAASYVDVVGGSTGTSTAPSAGSITTTEDYDLVFGSIFWDLSNSATLTAVGAGAVELDQNATTSKAGSFQSIAATTAGGYTVSGTLSASNSWAASAVSYKKA